MSQAVQIFTKEFRDYFVSPIAYIVIAIFLLVVGWFFFTPFFLFNQASLRSFFSLLPPVFAFVIPAVTMRLISEELNIGSYETLMTLPVKGRDIILGKYAAAVAFVACMLVPTIIYAVSVSLLGELDWGPVVGGLFGALLLGSAFSAIGLFASALTRNQIISFIVAVAICFTLTTIDRMLFFFPKQALEVIAYLGAGAHFTNIAKGIVDSRDILYFLSISFIGLTATTMVMDEKK